MIRIAAIVLALGACAQRPASEAPQWALFRDPQPVAILGYDGDAMEPFLSRDGALLFFNNRNDPADQTDLHWAERIDDITFQHRGRLESANSADLDGVPTMSADGRFCFVSPRMYEETLATIHCGQWRDQRVEAPMLQRDASVRTRGRVMFDVEISAQGDVLILADGEFRGGPMPATPISV